ncbi:MAG TPA: FGGY family carbohydrate kinase [Steroidobacteraceae bacterium]|nr:FGGY family carbohydrate kinase [Steroidobacteraceae bacterium]
MSDGPTELAWLAGELSSIRRQLLPEEESAGLFLALDQGGSASRAVLFDAVGRAVASAHVPVGTHREGADRVEHDAEELARSLGEAARDVCDSDLARDRPIMAAGLATQRSTIVCWERRGVRPLSAALSWADRRNAAWLERQLRPRAASIRALTGLPLSPHYGASKLRWCLDHLPEVQRAQRDGTLLAGPLSSFLLASLLDERPALVDASNAARTQLFDPDALDWSASLLEAFGIPLPILPSCVGTLHPFGTLSVDGRRIPLAACTGDQSAAAFAYGRPTGAVAFVNVGTGAFVQRVTEADAALPAGLLRSVLAVRAGGRAEYSHEGTVNGAAAAIDWLRERVALDVDRALHSLPREEPAEEPPLFMNGVGGLGAPFWLHSFPIEFIGGGSDPSLLTAVIESIAFLVAVNLEAMQRSAPLIRISISGGLSQCDYLCRAIADLSGLVVERYVMHEATARGIAFLAAGEPEDWQLVPVERLFEPAANTRLSARFGRWRSAMAQRGAAYG